jgi:hypothetical protein
VKTNWGIHVWGVITASIALQPVTGWGQMVGPNFQLPSCSKVDNEPALAVQGNHVLAVWQTDCVPRAPLTAASRDGGVTWQSTPIPWGGDGAFSPAAICAGDSGRFYLVAPSLYFGLGHSMDAHEGRFVGTSFVWSQLTRPVPLPYDTEASPVSLAIEFDPLSRNLYVAFTKVLAAKTAEYRTVFVRSTDLGQSWEPEQELTGPESAGAKLVVGLAGELAVVWENYSLGKLMGRRSSDFGASFGPEFELGPILDNLMNPGGWYTEHTRRHPLMAPGNSVCMQNPAAYSIALDRSTGPRRGTWYLVTTEHATGTVGPQMGTVAETEDNNTRAAADTIAVGNDVNGSVTASESEFDIDQFTFVGEAGQSIWFNGINFTVPGGGPQGWGVACGDDLATISGVSCINVVRNGSSPAGIYTLPTSGRYYMGTIASLFYQIGYRLRLRSYTVDPGSVARDHRDVLLCSSTDGGVTWSPKVRVSDGPVGSDDSFPEVAVDEDGRVHVAWYDRRDALQCGAETHTYWAYSDDGGQTFTPGVRVSEAGSQSGYANVSPWAVGDYLGLAAADGKVHVMWTRIPSVGAAEIWGTVIRDLPTPVLVSGLAAEGVGTYVSLRWWASDVSRVREFRVHRATETTEYQIVASLPALSDGEQRWQDDGAEPGVRYRYRLEVVLGDGVSVWEGPVVFTLPTPAVRLAWRAAVPNPFADTIELDLETPERGQTHVMVYDITGHRVAELTGEAAGDRYVVRWNGRDGHGRIVAPGVYLVRAQVGVQAVVRQVVRMK